MQSFNRQIVFVTTVLGALTLSNPDSASQFDTPAVELEQAQARFQDAKKTARANFARSFDTVVDKVRRSTIRPEMKAAKIARIQAERVAFLDSGHLPESEEMLPSLLRYQKALFSALKPLASRYRMGMAACVQNKDDAGLQKLNNEKIALDQELPGRSEFQSGTKWHGFRTDGLHNVDFKLHVDNGEGNTFKGTIWQGHYDSEGFKVEGLLDGTYMDFRSTQVIRGKTRFLHFTGYLMEGRIIASISGIATNGRPATGIVLLQRQ